LTAFQGLMIKYANYTEEGFVTIVCEPLRHDREKYVKSCGHREVCLTHKNGLINELPPVSAIISMPGLKLASVVAGVT